MTLTELRPFGPRNADLQRQATRCPGISLCTVASDSMGILSFAYAVADPIRKAVAEEHDAKRIRLGSSVFFVSKG